MKTDVWVRAIDVRTIPRREIRQALELTKNEGEGGVYKIFCKATQRLYVGFSGDIVCRWKGHLSDLICGVHKAKLMQLDFDRFGVDSFYFSAIEQCRFSDPMRREDHWQRVLKPQYNTLLPNI